MIIVNIIARKKIKKIIRNNEFFKKSKCFERKSEYIEFIKPNKFKGKMSLSILNIFLKNKMDLAINTS